MEIKGTNMGLMVAPLLFVPFIENAFKHVGKEKDTLSFIRIFFDLTQPLRILFSVANNKYLPDGMEHENVDGIGLINVRKRLDLLYPLKHELKITDSGNVFEVDLILELS
jgi:sensor histidine kinase YesM